MKTTKDQETDVHNEKLIAEWKLKFLHSILLFSMNLKFVIEESFRRIAACVIKVALMVGT